MGLFSSEKKHARTVALIDIGSASVGGAYACYESGKEPVLYYTARVDIAPRENETVIQAMQRSLTFLEQLLIEEGAPQLKRETGHGSITEVIVSIAAPWQQTQVKSTKIQEEKPFTFTQAHIKAVIDTVDQSGDRLPSGETIIATILNGYEMTHPFGKKATRADIIMLTSSLDKEVAGIVETSIRKAFHTHKITFTAFAPIAYSVFRTLYPHQQDFVVLDVSGSGTDVLFVKRGLLANVQTLEQGTQDLVSAAIKAGRRAHLGNTDLIDTEVNEAFSKEADAIESVWIKGLHDIFCTFSDTEALPHTVFLLADQATREYLQRILEESELRKLWLSDSPLSVIPIEPSHVAQKIATRGIGEPDLFLAMLALTGAESHKE